MAYIFILKIKNLNVKCPFFFRRHKESKAESSASIICHLIFTDLGLGNREGVFIERINNESLLYCVLTYVKCIYIYYMLFIAPWEGNWLVSLLIDEHLDFDVTNASDLHFVNLCFPMNLYFDFLLIL